MKTRAVLVLVVLGLPCFPAASAAQQQVGIRAGVSGDPDQFVFGGHLETATGSCFVLPVRSGSETASSPSP